jgi:cytochrome P450
LSWILLEVARHPEVYARIKQEIDAKIPANATHITPNQAAGLEYLDKVIKESMRLWPVAGLPITLV